MDKKIVVLYSGGLDSLIMLSLAKKQSNNVTAVYFDIGHEYAWKEKAVLPKEVIVHDMTWFKATGTGKDGNGMGNIFIPGRNMVFATIAASMYLPDEVWLGALMSEIHETATDKNIHYRDKQNHLLEYVLSPFKEKVKLVYPFVDLKLGKLGVTKLGLEMGLKDEIVKSSSCLNGEEGNCGRCGVCVRRAGIFPQVGLEEKYNTDPWTAKETQKYISDIIEAELNNDSSHYDEYRREELIPTLKKMGRL